ARQGRKAPRQRQAVPGAGGLSDTKDRVSHHIDARRGRPTASAPREYQRQPLLPSLVRALKRQSPERRSRIGFEQNARVNNARRVEDLRLMLTNSPSPSLRCRRDILAAREVFTIAQQEVPNWIGFRRLTLSENDIRVLKRLF